MTNQQSFETVSVEWARYKVGVRRLKKIMARRKGKTAKRKGQEEEMQSHVKDMFA